MLPLSVLLPKILVIDNFHALDGLDMRWNVGFLWADRVIYSLWKSSAQVVRLSEKLEFCFFFLVLGYRDTF